MKTPERRQWRQWRRSGTFSVQVFQLGFFSSVSFVDFEQLNVSWEPIQSICNTGQFTNFYAIKLVKTCIKFIFHSHFPESQWQWK